MQTTVLIYVKCCGAGVQKEKIPIDLRIGSNVHDLKVYILRLHPNVSVKRILFSGKLLKDDTKLLSDYGVYKECTIQIMLERLAPDVLINSSSYYDNLSNEVNDDKTLADFPENNSLDGLLNLINENQIDLTNVHIINKIHSILLSKNIINNSFPATPTLNLSEIKATEKQLYDYISNILPDSIKSLYYNIPKNDNDNRLRNYVSIQFKSTAFAVKALLNITIHSSIDTAFKSLICFGMPLKYEEIQIIESIIDDRKLNKDNIWSNIQCYLCKKILPMCLLYAPEGHKWFADRKMLNQYIVSCLKKKHFTQISTRFTASDLKDLLSKDLFEEFASKMLDIIIESKSMYVKCPTCSIAIETLPPSTIMSPEEATGLKKLRHARTSKHLQHAEMQLYRKQRIKCRNQLCQKDFCCKCLVTPYHIGNTCKSYAEEHNAPKCRFCGIPLNEQNVINNPISVAFKNVCVSNSCIEKMKMSSPKILSCGHVSYGVKQETYGELLVYGYVRCYINRHCPADLMRICILFYEVSYELPCLHKNCKLRSNKIKDTNKDACLLCVVEELGYGPCIEMQCHHVFHYQCIRKKLMLGSPTMCIDFKFMNCPLCKIPMVHPALEDIIGPLKKLQSRITKEAVNILEKRKDNDIQNPSHPYYGKPAEYATRIYVFYECYECKEPYYGGGREKDDYGDVSRKDLVCKDCQRIPHAVKCYTHNRSDWIYKCRYCCNKAKQCIGNKLHICNDKELSLYKEGGNVKLIEEYPQCSGLKDQIDTLVKDEKWGKWSRDQKDRELYKLRCKKLCLLKHEHPPNGFEFVIGCSKCQEKENMI
eukprot:137132_1